MNNSYVATEINFKDKTKLVFVEDINQDKSMDWLKKNNLWDKVEIRRPIYHNFAYVPSFDEQGKYISMSKLKMKILKFLFKNVRVIKDKDDL